MTKFGISYKFTLMILAGFALSANLQTLGGQDGSDMASVVPVAMTVGLSVPADKRMPEVSSSDLIIKRGKSRLRVTEWIPAQGDRDGLNLFILIDDACDPILGSHLDDIRAFVGNLPQTTYVGVGYMRNAVVQIAQDFTTDHTKAAGALRIPLGSVGAYGSPYLSVVDLMKRWPENANRREIIMITDGIDRAHRQFGFRTLDITPDESTASNLAQRTGTIIHTVYAPGVGHFHRNYWQANNGQIAIAKLSDETGGESYFLGFQNPVSLAPYLDDLQILLRNQYLLKFEAIPQKNAGLQDIDVSTEIAGVEFSSADAVWVPAAK
jgi:hypothetical protein